MSTADLPLTPYNGTSGHQGDASMDAEPSRQKAQLSAFGMARSMGAYGITVAEFRETFNIHHGIASSALSNLHKEGFLIKLKQRRNKCGIYVLPTYAPPDAATVPHHSRKTFPQVGEPVTHNEQDLIGVLTSMLADIEHRHPLKSRLHDDSCWMVHGRCALEEAIRRTTAKD